MHLSLRGKKITINQILWSKLWYIGQVYMIPKCTVFGKKLKKEQTISSGPTKYNTSQAPSSAHHIWKDGLSILDRYTREFFKN